ncbi:MAG: CotH kinase family protein [Prevotella sp.]|nr:CotH kinase family protein [Prevotella sp.]
MRKGFIIIMTVFACFVQAQNVDFQTLRNIGLPVVVVETIDKEEPSCEYLTPNDGYQGYSIRNATKVPGRIQVIIGDNTIYDSGDYEEDVSGMTIKLRGNNSAFTEKKPYKIKLQKKADMLGEDDVYKDKDWVLLKDEQPSLNLMVGLKVNELVGLQWTPRFRFVNLLFNGDYRGVYMLCESVKRNTKCRLNVSDSGFIFEMDPYWWNEDFWFKSNMSNRRYTFKYPESEDVTPEQLDYLIEYMTKVDFSPYDGTYEQYIDMESFASWVLGHDILGTYDASGSNIFITKYDDGDSTKLMMGNMWDFDTIEMVEDDFSKVHTFTGGFITNPLFSSNNETFTQAYKDKWEELRPTIFNQIEQFLKDFASSDIARALEESRVLDFNRWSITGPTVALNIISNIHWFKKRKFWLDRAIGNIVTDINNKNIEPEVSVNQYYNLHGQPISDKAKGLVITKGRKYMNR